MAARRQERVRRAENAIIETMDMLYSGGKGREMAKTMLRRYGSPGALIEAGKYHLMRDGLSEADALLFSMMPDMVRHIENDRMGEHPTIATLLQAEKFMRVRYIGVNIEQFYMLALDNSGKLIECVHMQSGNEDSAPFYLKHVLSETVRTNAKAVVISHNHPNVTPTPSQADLECTEALMYALGIIGAPLLDHIVMVGKRAVSVRGFGYVPEPAWSMQDPGNPLLINWLDGWDLKEATDALFHMKRNK